MSFPESLEALRLDVMARKARAEERQAYIDRIARECDMQLFIARVLQRLPDAWCDPDPGKYDVSYFFLDALCEKRIVVKEFLPKGVVVHTSLAEWQKYNAQHQYGVPFSEVPYWFKVVPLKDVFRARCSNCREEQPVIEEYLQTEDSPDGDTWRRRRFVPCLKCGTVTELAVKETSERVY